MEFLIGGLALIAFLFLRMKWSAKRKRMNLAFNVLLAQFTFYNEDMPTQNLIYERARSILSERTNQKFADRTFDQAPNLHVVFGFYALAMSELGIVPALPGYDAWFEVNNPFLAEAGIGSELKLATAIIEKKRTFATTIGLSDKKRAPFLSTSLTLLLLRHLFKATSGGFHGLMIFRLISFAGGISRSSVSYSSSSAS